MVNFDIYTRRSIMKDVIIAKKSEPKGTRLEERMEMSKSGPKNASPLSRKAQEMKIFLERNPVPKEFLKQK
ncbi:hypothetical protein [Dyadobacter fanqingshengii]|uniref:Uncharacterized protein n=1 Tax=Dyadobacter fanqingshengii TaxID=2906443 RepID=A0A9X1T9Z9_9BACT|nr:hypothetical protein [Dyadobacter fanqingshengii]MCF0041181.1 hypothetical protein [Dyadobacter fanqingshengii]USJ37093.1 hypothetical protein NFI81_04795 [Dyadobacter fanqingshengii]